MADKRGEYRAFLRCVYHHKQVTGSQKEWVEKEFIHEFPEEPLRFLKEVELNPEETTLGQQEANTYVGVTREAFRKACMEVLGEDPEEWR